MSDVPQPNDQLKAVIESFDNEAVTSVTEAKLCAFLDATKHVPLPTEEKLRRLAVALEFNQFEEGWKGMRRIYQAAAEANPRNPIVFHSWGISACGWFEDWMTPDLNDRLAIAEEAERVLNKALELAPGDADITHSLGMLFYQHPLHCSDRATYLSKALAWFRKSVEMNPENVGARLYVAHCLHDFASNIDPQYWKRAISAYEAVDQAHLAHDWPAWRAVKCREQLAACYAWDGQEEKAVHFFSKFLDEIEALEPDEFGSHDSIDNFDDLAAVLLKLKNPELLQRARVQVGRFQFEGRYPEFFSDEGR